MVITALAKNPGFYIDILNNSVFGLNADALID